MATAHRRRGVAAVLAASALAVASGCASHAGLSRAPGADVPLMRAADSLLAVRDFEGARRAYARARDSLAGTPAGSRAQYALAYLNVFYRNPSPDWDSAQQEFQRFVDAYPRSDSAEQANSWIRLLAALRAGEELNEQNGERLKEVLQRQTSVRQLVQGSNFDVLLDALRRCLGERDSLGAKVNVLEDVIQKIEKSR